jgi:hypothetical protein
MVTIVSVTLHSYPHTSKPFLQRAKVRKRRLEKVETYERGKQQPVRTHIPSKGKTGQNKDAREPPDDVFHFSPFLFDEVTRYAIVEPYFDLNI